MKTLTRKLLENSDDSIGTPCRVTFQGSEIGVYDTLGEMQNGIAEHIFNDVYGADDGDDGDVDIDSIRDDAIEHSLFAVEAFKNNTLPADASTIEVAVNGNVESYNGNWTFELL